MQPWFRRQRVRYLGVEEMELIIDINYKENLIWHFQ